MSFLRSLFGSGESPPGHKAPGWESLPKHPLAEIRQGQELRQEGKPAAPIRLEAPRKEAAGLYGKGDVIGSKYEVRGILGKGGLGVVYLAYDRAISKVCALKTFRDELLVDAAAREAFKKEVAMMVNLEEHPFLLASRWVAEFSGRLFLAMDYVAPDARGRVSLSDHLAEAGGPLDADQTLKWAAQFCMGMEHALARGMQCHRDIKPPNILITPDGTLKISDFGLAAAVELAGRERAGWSGSLVTHDPRGGFGLSLIKTAGKARCGTPGYMSPEVYRNEGADVRSDVYSFGLVLWQMAAGSAAPPFVVPYRGDLDGYLRQIYEQQMTKRPARVNGCLGSIVEQCLRPNPAERYATFGELLAALEPILEGKLGKKLEVPQVGEKTARFWNNKGGSLATLGRHEEAIACYDRALAIEPHNQALWNNKGVALDDLGRHQDAIACYDQALAIERRGTMTWNNKGVSLAALGRLAEAINCFDQALAIEPQNAMNWGSKGNALAELGRHGEAIQCYDRALAVDPRDARLWHNKGLALGNLGRFLEAVSCFDRGLVINPRYAAAWKSKGLSLNRVGRYGEGARCYEQARVVQSHAI